MAGSMPPPRTKAQGWLLVAKSDTKDMEQDHFWTCGEHDITCRKWKKGPPKNATVTAVAGNGARWKRGDDEKNENKKPNEGTKVVPMTGVEEQPEDTEETGQQRMQQGEIYTSIGENTAARAVRAPSAHRPRIQRIGLWISSLCDSAGTAEQQNRCRKHGPKQTAKERSHAQTQGTLQLQIADSLEAVLGTWYQSHHHHRGWEYPERRGRVA